MWKPAIGFVVGLLATASVITYFAKPGLRPMLDRVFLVAGDTKGRRFGLAITALLWSVLMLVGSVAVWQGNTEAEERAEQDAAAAAEKKQADEAARTKLLASANQKLDSGDLDGARKDLVAAERYGATSDAAAIRQKLADALHQRDVASLPGVLEGILAHNAAQEWDAALGDCTRAKAIDGEFPGLEEACVTAAEGQRVAAIPGWIKTANAVAADEKRCDTPVEIADAWKDLRQVKSEDPGYKKAQMAATKLEKCRKSSERAFSKGIRDFMIHQRVQWAETYELGLLDEGLDVKVTLSGKHKTKVKIRWVLLTRANVHQIVRDGTFLAALEKIGFEKVTFSDGFYESWYYELDPQSEKDGGKAVLAEFGLDKPLSL